MKAVIYSRFSPRRNAALSESIETQLDYCRGYCGDKEYEIVGEYEDRALSGSDEDRPGLWAALAALRRGYVLVSHKLDRLARDVYLSEVIFRQVRKLGARIEVVEGSIEDDTPEQRFVRQILQAFAEYERKAIAARTRAAMLRHQATGRRMSERPPYGYQHDPSNPGYLMPNSDEQATLALMIELRKTGQGFRQIGRSLKEEGRHARNGGAWQHRSISRILRRFGL